MMGIHRIRASYLVVMFVVTVCVLMVGSPQLLATAVLPQSELNPDPIWEGQDLMDPLDVPGKEYSDDPDKDCIGNVDPMQNIGWKGDGTTVWDKNFDYSIDSYPTEGEAGVEEFSEPVDALANSRDLYFQDLINNRISMLLSFEAVGDIHYSRPTHIDVGPEQGIWADADLNINSGSPPEDVDGLEIWGPDDAADANMFSVRDDSVNGVSGAAVFKYDPDTHTSTSYLTAATLAGVIIKDNGDKANLTAEQVDVDAMLIWDIGNDDVFNDTDMIVFSIAPVTGIFDGGEIWVYKHGEDKASFLSHGSITWNTDNDVSTLFGVTTENINALEALPEPSAFLLLGLGSLSLLRRRRRA